MIHFITNTLHFYRNDKGDIFFLFRKFFDINIIVFVIDNNWNIERVFAGWEYCNLYYFCTIDVLI